MLGARRRARGPASSRIIARGRQLSAVGRGGNQRAMTATGLNLSSTTSTGLSGNGGGNSQRNTEHSTSEASQLTNGGNGGQSGGELNGPGNQATISNVYEVCKGVMGQLKGIDGRLKRMEDKQVKLSDTVKELNDIIKKFTKESYTIKGSPHEATLKGEVGKLFCHSLERKPDDKDLQAAIVKTLGYDARDKHKFDTALKYAKDKLTDFRSEERRKVLGQDAYNAKYCFLSTRDLATEIMRQMGVADDTNFDLYVRHLTLLRKFAREMGEECPNRNYYVHFREWISTNYSEIGEETWQEFITEDEGISYHLTAGSGYEDGTRSQEQISVNEFIDNVLNAEEGEGDSE